MDSTFSIDLKEPYHSFSENGEWCDYITALSQDGIAWWFNMEIPRLILHLAPLGNLPQEIKLPFRLLFLEEAVKRVIPTERIEEFYQAFLKQNDLEAACAAAGAGMASIWDSGTGFDRFDIWYERANYLLGKWNPVSALARSSLLVFKSMVEIIYHGRLGKATVTLKDQLSWAEKADSTSLRVFHSCLLGYCLIHTGDFATLEMVFFNTAPLCNLPETSLICKIQYQIAFGLFQVIKGRVLEGIKVLRDVINHPIFNLLPISIWLLGYGNLLFASSFAGDAKIVEEISEKIHDHTIPEQNHFHQAYIHYNLGIASLVLGRPQKALVHGREGMDRAIKCNSPIHKRLAALLVGQALADLEEFQESFEHLTSWIDKWEKSGLRTLAIAGALEISSLLLKKGKMEEARKYYVQASNLLPKGENILNLYRPIEFLEKLKRSLHPDSVEVEDLLSEAEAPVRIQTFGELRVQIGDQILYDRKWRGGRTKALLKALIIYGGEKVSKDLLIDALWPDADGDLAMTNLKVALSRLRRVGCEKGQEPLPWIVVRHRHISLVKSLCFVDSIQFKSTLFAALKDRENEELLFKALDLYKNDFLVNDASEMWIIKHREVLREEFIKGVMVLSERCLEIEKLEEALPYLNKAVEKDPLHEGLYANLMKTYLKMGYPSRALKIFRQAKEIFQQELGIEPNSPLLALAQEASGKK